MVKAYIYKDTIEKDNKFLLPRANYIFDEYLTNEIFKIKGVQEIVKDVDKIKSINGGLLITEDDVEIYKNDLSSGSKNLIVMLYGNDEDVEDVVFRSSNLGENCYKHLNKLSKNINRDIYLFLDYTPLLSAFPIDMYIIEKDTYVSSFLEYGKVVPLFRGDLS